MAVCVQRVAGVSSQGDSLEWVMRVDIDVWRRSLLLVGRVQQGGCVQKVWQRAGQRTLSYNWPNWANGTKLGSGAPPIWPAVKRILKRGGKSAWFPCF